MPVAKMGRPPKMKDARGMTVSIPAQLLREVVNEARLQKVTRSEIVRRALAYYFPQG